MIEDMIQDLSRYQESELDEKIQAALGKYPFAKAIYALDRNGLQATRFVCDPELKLRKGIFRLPSRGTDYSTRDFYYGLVDSGFNRDNYTSEAYISPATGLFCLTISAKIKDKLGTEFILCVDVEPTYLKHMGKLVDLIGDLD